MIWKYLGCQFLFTLGFIGKNQAFEKTSKLEVVQLCSIGKPDDQIRRWSHTSQVLPLCQKLSFLRFFVVLKYLSQCCESWRNIAQKYQDHFCELQCFTKLMMLKNSHVQWKHVVYVSLMGFILKLVAKQRSEKQQWRPDVLHLCLRHFAGGFVAFHVYFHSKTHDNNDKFTGPMS